MHCLSFEVEEHFQVSRFDSPMRRRHWNSFQSRVVANTERLLDVLAQHGTRATFFVLGWVAERHPKLVKAIAASGHEIASHGYNHEMVTAQTPELFRDDVRRAKAVLEDLAGSRVLGYRAPGFTITRDTPWAFPVLVEEGYVYDSSVIPIRTHRPDPAGSDPFLHLRNTSSGYLWEVPPTTVRLAAMRWPVAGGSCFRLLPFSMLRALLRRCHAHGHTLVMYFHVWEFDTAHPRMEGPFISQLLHYLNLHKVEARLLALLNEYFFSPIIDYIALSDSLQAEEGPLLPAVSPVTVTPDMA